MLIDIEPNYTADLHPYPNRHHVLISLTDDEFRLLQLKGLLGLLDESFDDNKKDETDDEAMKHMKFLVNEYVLCDENNLTKSAKNLRKTVKEAVIEMYKSIKNKDKNHD